MEPLLVSLANIHPNPYQPRGAEDPAVVAEIAASIFHNGLLQVPAARKTTNGHYELVFGHTRKAAYDLLAGKGLPEAGIAPDARFAVMPITLRELSDRQMFEMAVAENVKRRDLDPIEQARAMQRYMDEFQATSIEAGELFGVKDATVRGKVRLLALPVKVQQKLAQGAISEGTARALLSLGKIAGGDDVVKALEEVEKKRGDQVPEDVIASQAYRLKGAVHMWASHNNGEPRAGRGLWPLGLKQFPKKLLPTLTGHTAVQALDCFADKPAQKLVLEWAEHLAAGDKAGMQRCLEEMAAIDADYVSRLEHLQNPPACTACEHYASINGSHFCGLKACHERKVAAWKAHLVEQASKATGIAVYTEADGKFLVLDNWDDKHRKLYEGRDVDLRFIAHDQVKGYHWQSNYKGFDDDFVLAVVVGKTLKKWAEAMRAKRAGEKAKENARAEARDMLEGMRERLVWEAAGQCAHLFDALNAAALTTWDEIDEMVALPVDRPKEAQVVPDFTRRALAFWMFDNSEDFNMRWSWKKATDVAGWLTETARSWGVEISLEAIAIELDAALAAVAVETAAPA